MKYSMQRTVHCSMIGSDNKIRNSALVDLLQDCSLYHLEHEPVLTPFFEAENCIMFLISRQLDITRLPEYNEKLVVKTWCYELNRMYGFRNTMIYDESGAVCVSCVAGGCFMDKVSQRVRKVPQDLIDRIEYEKAADMEYASRKISLPQEQPQVFEPVKIRRCDIDMNRHVNNAKYLDITDEFLPDGAEIQRIRCEYKMPIKLDSVVIPKVFHSENTVTVDLCNESGKSFTVVEYVLKA